MMYLVGAPEVALESFLAASRSPQPHVSPGEVLCGSRVRGRDRSGGKILDKDAMGCCDFYGQNHSNSNTTSKKGLYSILLFSQSTGFSVKVFLRHTHEE